MFFIKGVSIKPIKPSTKNVIFYFKATLSMGQTSRLPKLAIQAYLY